MHSIRNLKYTEAVLEAQDLLMEKDKSVFIIGLGAPDPKGIFGTTSGLVDKYGSRRVLDMPLSENAVTGVAIGAALRGMRPILTHQRLDFAILSMDQIVNQAAKWHYMFNGKGNVPLVIRMAVGRGWGQGPQHSQSLQAWFAHIPGLKVVMPFSPYDAKGLLISSVEDNNPVIFIEHRWLHGTHGEVPEGIYRVPLGKAKIVKPGKDITLLGVSHMVMECIKAANLLEKMGVSAEVVDVRTLRPLDEETILESVTRTGRLLVADTGTVRFGASAELTSFVCEKAFSKLKIGPQRIGLPDCPNPTSPALASSFYPGCEQILSSALEMLNLNKSDLTEDHVFNSGWGDQPDSSFTGPF